MALYEWEDRYKVGNDFIDFDHKKLFRMIEFYNTASARNTAQYELEAILDSLAKYAKEHFKREEDEMLRLDANGFLLHKLEHKKFLVQIVEWKELHARGEFTFSISVSRFLNGWLKNHILKTDQLLADAIRTSNPQAPTDTARGEAQAELNPEIKQAPRMSLKKSQ
jgi:hemerythrin